MASKCAEGRIMNRRIARDSFFDGLLKIGVRFSISMVCVNAWSFLSYSREVVYYAYEHLYFSIFTILFTVLMKIFPVIFSQFCLLFLWRSLRSTPNVVYFSCEMKVFLVILKFLLYDVTRKRSMLCSLLPPFPIRFTSHFKVMCQLSQFFGASY